MEGLLIFIALILFIYFLLKIYMQNFRKDEDGLTFNERREWNSISIKNAAKKEIPPEEMDVNRWKNEKEIKEALVSHKNFRKNKYK